MRKSTFSSFQSLSDKSDSENIENVRVAVRIRPKNSTEQGREETVSVLGKSTIILKKGNARHQMKFDRVFSKEVGQEEVYGLCKQTIDTVLKGYNATVLAYGQTGTGKTYTMLGPDTDYSSYSRIPAEVFVNPKNYVHDPNFSDVVINRGLIPRSVHHILKHVNRTKNHIKYSLYCSYMEIYNEKIYDLLSDNDHHEVALDIRQDRNKGIFVKGITTISVSTAEEIFKLMQAGARNRSIRSTEMNERSSRSHSIFRLYIKQEPVHPNSDGMVTKVSKLNLGSEKWRTFSKFKMQDARIAEMTSINQSLATLGNCISALNQKGRSHIPFRDSKLTRILQDSLGGNCKTLFVATISPSVMAFDETHSTLKFADRAMRVTMKTYVNEVVDDSVLIKRYEKEIDRLRNQLKRAGEIASDELVEENRKLREDNFKLVSFLREKGQIDAAMSHESTDQAIRTTESKFVDDRLNEKLKLLEEIERDQNEREKELNQYHNWLHSLPIIEEDEDCALDIKDKLKLMESGIQRKGEELERAKKLYLRDLKILKQEICEKDQDLITAKETIRKQSEIIASLSEKSSLGFEQSDETFEQEETVSNPQERLKKNHLPELDGKNRSDENQILKLLDEYAKMKMSIKSQQKQGIQTFQNRLSIMLSEYLEDELYIKETKELKQLIEGSCEALTESVIHRDDQFLDQFHCILKSLYEVSMQMSANARKERFNLLKKLRNVKNQSNESVSCQTEDVELHDEIKHLLNMSSNARSSSNCDRDFWKQVVQGVERMREFQTLIWSRTANLKNCLKRTCGFIGTLETNLRANLKDADGPVAQSILFHREQLETILKLFTEDVDKFCQQTFMKSEAETRKDNSLNQKNENGSPARNMRTPLRNIVNSYQSPAAVLKKPILSPLKPQMVDRIDSPPARPEDTA